MYSYRACGLQIASEIDLRGLMPFPAGQEPPDVRIRLDSVPAELNDATASGPTWQMSQACFLLRVPGIARLLMRSGNEICFEAEAGTSLHDIAIFLIGTAFAILLHQRRRFVLRASAVRVGDKAVLFCGASGAGKSTLVAALGARGYPLLSDDICTMDTQEAGGPIVHADGHTLALWGDAIRHLGLGDRSGSALRIRLDKFHVDPQLTCTTSLQLGAVYALRTIRAPLVDAIERPNVIDTALVLNKNAYHPRLVAEMSQKAAYFLAAADIGAKVGVFHLSRSLDLAGMAATLDALEAHWHEIGLKKGALP